MKKHLLVLAVLLVSISAFSQPKKLKYHRVFIPAENGAFERVLQLGITVDHSHYEPTGLTTEISETEVQTLKDNGVPFKILIHDMSAYYTARNEEDKALRPAAAGVCNLPQVPVPSNFQLGSMGGYFTLLEMENILNKMALLYPNLITVKQPISTIQSFEGRNIWYVKISDNPNVDENEPEVLYTALHHAREAASLSQLVFYMWHLLENYATDPDVKATLDNTELFFVPCVNPDGYYYNETTDPNGGGMWRRNRRLNSDGTYGVDLNRNYGMNWGYDNIGSSPLTSNDTYRGTGAFSEPETQAMQAFCNSRQFKNALNAHTFSNVLIYPWGHIPSFYTPDDITFREWGKLLTRDTRFLYGTCDQTLNYITNGCSDDWMYGEQTTKPKIMAMTPEAGTFNDGFWPAQSRIVDICKTTFRQNYDLARLAGDYAKIFDEQDQFIYGNGYIKYKLRRLGLSGGSYTVSINPVGSGLATVGPSKIYTGVAPNQLITDSIAFTTAGGLSVAQPVKYELVVNNGTIARPEQVSKTYGMPDVEFYDDGSSVTSNFDLVGTWGVSASTFVSPPASITDSPGSDYGPNDQKMITTQGQIDLQNAVYAHFQFYTKFEIEKTFDEVQIEVSTNNGANYSPLCGKYETSPASSGANYPVYDGRQDDWVKDEIDLADYLGKKIKLRFRFTSDFYTEKDGFYFDEMLVRKLVVDPSAVMANAFLNGEISLGPNPTQGIFSLYNPGGKKLEVKIFNSLGQLVFENRNVDAAAIQIDLSGKPAGMYFVKLNTGSEELTTKLVLRD